MVRTSISNHHPSDKRKKPKPRHNAPCLRQLVRYKLYEIRLDTLKNGAMLLPSRAIFAPLSIIVKPSFRNFSKKRISIPFLKNIHRYYSRLSIKPQVAFKILSVTILNALPLPLLSRLYDFLNAIRKRKTAVQPTAVHRHILFSE